MNPQPHDTPAALVPLSDLITLARLGQQMRRAQKAYFEKRKAMPGVPADSEYRLARDYERRFDAAARTAMQREQQALPGMGDDSP